MINFVLNEQEIKFQGMFAKIVTKISQKHITKQNVVGQTTGATLVSF